MQHREKISDFVRQYISNHGDCYQDVFTQKIYLDRSKVQRDMDKILAFYIENFDLNASAITPPVLLSTKEGNIYTSFECDDDVRLLEEIVALGYEANILINDYSIKYNQFSQMPKAALKYMIPEEFCYKGEEYYARLFDVMCSFLIIVNTALIERGYYRHYPDKELVTKWFIDGLDSNDVHLMNKSLVFLDDYENEFIKMASMINSSPYGQKEMYDDLEGKVDRSFKTILFDKYTNLDPGTLSLEYDSVESFLYDLDKDYQRVKKGTK